MNKYLGIFLLVVVVGMAACIPVIKLEEEPTLGSLNIDQFLVLGDRYVAGFSNGNREAGGSQGLYEAAQLNSFPNLMAEQFLELSKVERQDSLVFRQHLLPEPGSGYFVLDEISFRECDGAILNEALSFVQAQPDWINWRPESYDIHNLGIPFMRVGQMFDPTEMELNPFFQRMEVRGTEPATYSDLLKEKEPSLMLLWLGMEDLLSHAIRGGSNSAFQLTSTELFAENMARLMDSLLEVSADKWLGVIGNLPDVTQFPYFSSVPPQTVNGEDCKERGDWIYYENSDGKVKIADGKTRLLLPVWSLLGEEMGVGGGLGLSIENPVPNYLVLDEAEQEGLRAATDSYNQVLDSLVDVANGGSGSPKWILVDLEKAFRDLNRGFTQGGLEVSMDHLSGGIFSLDGISLTHRGNAFVANEFMEAIDSKAKQGIRLNSLNLGNYSGVVYP